MECGFGGAAVAYKKKAALPDGAFAGGHNARMHEIEGRFANAAAPSAEIARSRVTLRRQA